MSPSDSHPAIHGTSSRCADELIGMNSVSPWSRPTSAAWMTTSSVAPPYRMKSGARTSVIVASSFTSTWSDGPAVSLKGSPTVSPTTAAA